MAEAKKQILSFDEYLQADRKKRKNERLAQEMLGKGRPGTPSNKAKPQGFGGSLASRVGVSKVQTKRPSSVPRTNSSTARNPPRSNRPREPLRQSNSTSAVPKNNGFSGAAAVDSANGEGGLSIKGAAGGPYIVMASNFVPGTTAADIESVMASVGGEMTYCKLVASSPTVIAEMGFTERTGADTVINTFNNKKADGRLLYVYMRNGSAPSFTNPAPTPAPPVVPAEPEAPASAIYEVDESMEVDENAKSREAENRLREERRGGAREDGNRPDVFPSGPRGNARNFGGDGYYYNNRGPPRAEPEYQDGRYGVGGGGFGGRRGYYDDRRGYGRGGGQWRS